MTHIMGNPDLSPYLLFLYFVFYVQDSFEFDYENVVAL